MTGFQHHGKHALHCLLLSGMAWLLQQYEHVHHIDLFAVHRRPSTHLSDRHLQLQLLHVLLQGQTPLGSSQEGGSLVADAMQPPSCLPPTSPGPPYRDMPAALMNRDQLLQELFKLELDCQDPQV